MVLTAALNASSFNCTTLYNNTNCNEKENSIVLSQAVVIVLSVVNSLSVIFGTFGNTLVLLAVTKNKCLQTVPDLFIFSLAIADLLVTILRQPMWIHVINNYEKLFTFQARLFYLILDGIGFLSLLASVTNILAVTIDRYLAICRPFQYLAIATTKNAIFVILSTWGISISMTVTSKLYGAMIYLVWGYIVLALSSTIIIYIYLLKVARRQQRRVNPISEATSDNTSQTDSQKCQQKAAKTIGIVVGVFVVCWVPFLVVSILPRRVRNEDIEASRLPSLLSFSLAQCNSAINPYIYCARNSRYRSAFMKLFGKNVRDIEASATRGGGGEGSVAHHGNQMTNTLS